MSSVPGSGTYIPQEDETKHRVLWAYIDRLARNPGGDGDKLTKLLFDLSVCLMRNADTQAEAQNMETPANHSHPSSFRTGISSSEPISAHGYQDTRNIEEHAAGEPALQQNTALASHPPHATNPFGITTPQASPPRTIAVNPLQQPVPFLPNPSEHQRLVPSMAEHEYVDDQTIPDSSQMFWLGAHRLGGRTIHPSPGPIPHPVDISEDGDILVLASQLPIWNEQDLLVDVMIRDVGETGYYFTAQAQTFCLIAKDMGLNDVQIARLLHDHMGAEALDALIYRIIPNISAIPSSEVHRLIDCYPLRHIMVRNVAADNTRYAASVEAPSLSVETQSQLVERSGLPAETPSFSATTPSLSTANSSVSAGFSGLPVNTLTQPDAESSRPVEGPSIPGEAPSGYAALSSTPPTQTTLPYVTLPDEKWRKRSEPRPRVQKPKGFEWNDEHNAFLVYYIEKEYLLAQVHRMFNEHFGCGPTLQEMRNQLELIDENNGEVKSRTMLRGLTSSGVFEFAISQQPALPTPTTRETMEPIEPPFRKQHIHFASFFRNIGLDNAVIHEIFETHFKGTITEEQLDDILKKSIKGKKISVEARQENWFKYLEEGQIGFVDSKDIQKSINMARARARSIMKKESFERRHREEQAKEKGEADAAAAPDGIVADSVEGEQQPKPKPESNIGKQKKRAESGKRKKKNARDLRPEEDRERSGSPK